MNLVSEISSVLKGISISHYVMQLLMNIIKWLGGRGALKSAVAYQKLFSLDAKVLL